MVCSFVQKFITKTLPEFLAALPVPKDLEGFKDLSPEQLGQVIAVFFVFATIILMPLMMGGAKEGRLNHKQQMDKDKVVDIIPIPEAMAKAQTAQNGKVVLCRCWKSKTFPYCDGSHVEHNKKTGDNVGPLILTK
eukprot:TRINITY_DN2626_c0_g1_i1.p5 TRINITY_DN2626_c0_g1~~TRINITY_DN2626_c0_g1_i1.p5  ORF type:complete len:135 (+),score=64.98 TRINITY_DN2626_c0_g1_i1:76-480(+)